MDTCKRRTVVCLSDTQEMLSKYLELPTAHGQGNEVVEELLLLRDSEVAHVTRQGAIQGAAVPAG